jgi:hypothetical protein
MNNKQWYYAHIRWAVMVERIWNKTSLRLFFYARGGGNDSLWKEWKTMKLFSHSSHRPWKSLRRLPHSPPP